MSEPTYRVELTHHPENGLGVRWEAAVYEIASGDTFPMHTMFGADREQAFDHAQGWIKAKAQAPDDPSTVFLTEDGDILDPHEVQG